MLSLPVCVLDPTANQGNKKEISKREKGIRGNCVNHVNIIIIIIIIIIVIIIIIIIIIIIQERFTSPQHCLLLDLNTLREQTMKFSPTNKNWKRETHIIQP